MTEQFHIELNESTPLRPTTTPPSNANHTDIQMFQEIDSNRDGLISKHEFSKYFRNTFKPEELQRIFHKADTNKDGQLDYKEFVKIACQLYGTKYLNWVVPLQKRRITRRSIIIREGDEYKEVRNEYEVEETVELYEVQCNCSPPNLGMIIISFIELVFFIIDQYVEESTSLRKKLRYDSCRRIQIWRFFTYSLIHSNGLHLSANILVQLLFGIPLEMFHGWWRILLIYLSGVISGSLVTSVMDPGQKLVGASAGVYAMITAHIANIIMNWSQLRRGTYPGLQLFILLLISSTDLGTSISRRYFYKIDDHVGYAAHFAGAVAGLLVGVAVLKNLKVRPHEQILWWFAAILYGTLILAAIFWNIFNITHFSRHCTV